GWQVNDVLRRRCKFEERNLLKPFTGMGTFDVIFCRNVMIYFDDDMKTRVLSTFGDQIAADGTLFIGHSESIRGLNVPFEGLTIPQGFCYRKA
ncbi:MAG: CheR family methyltransferase, partial [Planctomycetota bacterium]